MVHQSKSSESSCYSDLEVVPGKGVEIVPIGLEPVPLKDLEANSWKPSHSVTTKVEPVHNDEECEDGKKTGRVCGLRLRTFWIVLVVGTIVVAASVGAAIVGSLLRKRVVPAKMGSMKLSASILADLSISTISTTSSAPTMSMATDSPAATTAATATATDMTTAMASKTRPMRMAATTTPTRPPSTSSAAFPTSGQLDLDCPHLDGKGYISKASPFSAHNFKIWCNTDYESLQNISVFNTTSIQDCIDLCSLVDTNDPNRPCRGIVFNTNIADALAHGGTCFLKADVTAPFVRSDLEKDSYAGAVLMR
ncbi:hypothetical protein MMC30_004853 [Trapelia coarctata]|nr:hypothetical protein [Trapelia coarctata]